jgi:hypothetical protein
MKSIEKLVLWLLASAATLSHAHNLLAQDTGERNPAYGTTAYSESPDLSAVTADVVGPVRPTVTLKEASYATGGVALRNRGAGNISISGLVGAPRLTFLYWAVITVGAPTAADRTIEIQRLDPVPVSPLANVNGVVVGVGPTPCWGPRSAIITVFRGEVPATVATGNGSYQLTLLPGAGGKVDGADPWIGAPVLPLLEGASLVMIGKGSGTVSVFDAGLAGKTFEPNPGAFNYVLALPVAATAGKRMLLDNIGADGQHVDGASREAVTSFSDETTTINGFPIAGQGSDYVDSDWNGSSGLPVPELWDDTGHNISIVSENAGGPVVNLNVVIHSALGPADCLTPVANVVEED